MTLCALGQSLCPGAQHAPPLEELPGLSSLCISLLNQPKSKAQPLLPSLGGPPEVVWAQLSFAQAHGQSQKQLSPKLSLKHREGSEAAGLQQQSVD